MRTAEEYASKVHAIVDLKRGEVSVNDISVYVNSITIVGIIDAINEARKEAIIECSKRAIVIEKSDAMSGLYQSSMIENLLSQKHCYIDKQSILSLINELK